MCPMVEMKALLSSCKLLRRFSHNASRGKIHSRFQNAINIELCDSFLFNLIPYPIPPNPRSLLLPLFAWNRIQDSSPTVGMEVLIEDEKVKVPSIALVISFEASESWDSIPLLPGPPVLEEEVRRNLQVIAKAIKQRGNNGTRSLHTGRASIPALKAFEDRIQKGADALCIAIINRDPVNISKSSHQLLGLGSGLTPSGDDVIAGLMAAGVFCALAYRDLGFDVQKINTQIVVHALGRTTTFSQVLLSDASRGEVARPLGQLLQKVLCGGEEELIVSLTRQVMVLGASSGKDMLDGVLLGMEAFLRLKDKIGQKRKRKVIQHVA